MRTKNVVTIKFACSLCQVHHEVADEDAAAIGVASVVVEVAVDEVALIEDVEEEVMLTLNFSCRQNSLDMI